MAENITIPELPQLTALNGAVQLPAASGNTDGHATLSQLTDYMRSQLQPITATERQLLSNALPDWYGTQQQYNALSSYDAGRWYFITLDDEVQAVYRGDQLITAIPNMVGEFTADSNEDDWYWYPNSVKTPIPVDPFTRKFSVYYPIPLTTRYALFWTDNGPNMGENIVSLTKIPSISGLTEIRWVLSNLRGIPTSPAITTANATDVRYLYQNCNELVFLPTLDTAKASKWDHAFNNCIKLRRIDGLDFSAVETISAHTFNCPALTYLKLANLGKGPCTSYPLHPLVKWGTGGESNRASLIDSLLTNSYDRAANGKSAATISLSAATMALLSAAEKSAITAKGFTLVTA